MRPIFVSDEPNGLMSRPTNRNKPVSVNKPVINKAAVKSRLYEPKGPPLNRQTPANNAPQTSVPQKSRPNRTQTNEQTDEFNLQNLSNTSPSIADKLDTLKSTMDDVLTQLAKINDVLFKKAPEIKEVATQVELEPLIQYSPNVSASRPTTHQRITIPASPILRTGLNRTPTIYSTSRLGVPPSTDSNTSRFRHPLLRQPLITPKDPVLLSDITNK